MNCEVFYVKVDVNMSQVHIIIFIIVQECIWQMDTDILPPLPGWK
jgi:hypothetical protein